MKKNFYLLALCMIWAMVTNVQAAVFAPVAGVKYNIQRTGLTPAVSIGYITTGSDSPGPGLVATSLTDQSQAFLFVTTGTANTYTLYNCNTTQTTNSNSAGGYTYGYLNNNGWKMGYHGATLGTYNTAFLLGGTSNTTVTIHESSGYVASNATTAGNSSCYANDGTVNYTLTALPTVLASKTSLVFTTATPTQTFTVTGYGTLTSAATLTAPTGITFSPSTITLAQLNAGTATTVTATYDGVTQLSSGSVTISSTGATVPTPIPFTVASSALIVSPSTLAFTTVTNTNTFTVQGSGLTADVSFTAPSGITLSPSTIPMATANAGAVTVTATYDGVTSIASGNISVNSGTTTPQSIAVTGAVFFVPTANTYYNIVETDRTLNIDASGTQPVTVARVAGKATQAFQFIKVSGTTYYIQNAVGNYLTSTGTYSTVFQATNSTTNSQWIVSGSLTATTLQNVAIGGSSNYLDSQNGINLYDDNAARAYGQFTMTPLTTVTVNYKDAVSGATIKASTFVSGLTASTLFDGSSYIGGFTSTINGLTYNASTSTNQIASLAAGSNVLNLTFVAAPGIGVSANSIEFIGTATQTFTAILANLTSSVAVTSSDPNVTVSPTSIAQGVTSQVITVTVAPGTTAPGTITLTDATDVVTKTVSYSINPVANRYYKIVQENGGLVMGGTGLSGAGVVLAAYTGSTTQLFQLGQVSGTTYTLQNALGNYVSWQANAATTVTATNGTYTQFILTGSSVTGIKLQLGNASANYFATTGTTAGQAFWNNLGETRTDGNFALDLVRVNTVTINYLDPNGLVLKPQNIISSGLPAVGSVYTAASPDTDPFTLNSVIWNYDATSTNTATVVDGNAIINLKFKAPPGIGTSATSVTLNADTHSANVVVQATSLDNGIHIVCPAGITASATGITAAGTIDLPSNTFNGTVTFTYSDYTTTGGTIKLTSTLADGVTVVETDIPVTASFVEAIRTSVSNLTFNNLTRTATFTAYANIIDGSATALITSPSTGITLSGTTFALNNGTPTTITVNFVGSTSVTDNITLTVGSLTQTIAVSAIYTPQFVPETGGWYNVMQSSSSLQIGGTPGSQATVMTANAADLTQLFTFIPVSGKLDTYNLKNAAGNYLNGAGNYPSLVASLNGLNTEWMMVGTTATGVRLKVNSSQYIASDGITSGSTLWCDKTNTNANGTFNLSETSLTVNYLDQSSNVIQTARVQTTGLTPGATYTATGSDKQFSAGTTQTYVYDGVSVDHVTVAAGNNVINLMFNIVDNASLSYTFTGGGSTHNLSDATNWMGGSLPVSGSSITVASGELVIDQPVSVNNITVNPLAKLTNSGQTLTATALTLNSDATGTATFVDNGSSAIGTANVNQFLTGATGTSARAWWYVASPVTAATSSVFSVGTTNQLWYYNETTNPAPSYTSISDNVTTLNPGTGYVAYLGGADAAYTFTGTLNNGPVTLNPTRTGTTADKRGFNLIGNPYPSFLDWNAVTKTNVMNTIWYRTVDAGGLMQFDTYDGTYGTGNGVNGIVTQFIPPMQAFWTKVIADGDVASLGLDNTMRSHQDQSQAGNRLRAKATTAQAQVLRLKVSNGTTGDEALVVTNPNATDSYDSYDSPKMTNSNAAIPEIYTLAGTQELAINNLNTINPGTELALGFRTGTANTFTITATQLSNFDADTKVILIDNLLNTQTDLTDGSSYTFTSDAITTTTRLSVVFKSASVATGINGGSNGKEAFTIYKNGENQITVQRSNAFSKAGTVTITNAVGQKLLSTVTTGTITTVKKTFPAGVYMVTVNADGVTTTQKVIIN